MPKWVYPLAFLFVLFLIYSQPTNAGQAASSFASFGGDVLSAIGEFLNGLFGSSDNASSGSSIVSNTTSDTITHTHDGLAPHSHPVGE